MTVRPPAPSPTAEVKRAVLATYAAFIGAGIAFATWASRIPQIRDQLDLRASELGVVLLAGAAGSVLALPLSGPVVSRFGSRRTVTVAAVLLSVALVAIGAGYHLGVAILMAGLFVFGAANAMWDVAMNVHGALAERELGRSIMPRFHAGYSVGTVGGALVGALMVWLGVPVSVHLIVAGAVLAAGVPVVVRGFLDDRTDVAEPAPADASAGPPDPNGAAAPARPRSAWREPRTLLIGLFVLAFAFAEGTGNDWVAVALIDGYHTSAAVGTLGFAVFLTAMTAGRWFGPALLDRYGRVLVVRTMAVLGVVGLTLFVFGGATVVAFAGAVLWGVGVSLGFPVGMSAGADEPARAPMRVSVIASIGYCAFLGGPPLIGFLGDQYTVLRALMAVAALLAVSIAVADAVRPPATSQPADRPRATDEPAPVLGS